jgi:hypothetical protein
MFRTGLLALLPACACALTPMNDMARMAAADDAIAFKLLPSGKCLLYRTSSMSLSLELAQ